MFNPDFLTNINMPKQRKADLIRFLRAFDKKQDGPKTILIAGRAGSYKDNLARSIADSLGKAFHTVREREDADSRFDPAKHIAAFWGTYIFPKNFKELLNPLVTDHPISQNNALRIIVLELDKMGAIKGPDGVPDPGGVLELTDFLVTLDPVKGKEPMTRKQLLAAIREELSSFLATLPSDGHRDTHRSYIQAVAKWDWNGQLEAIAKTAAFVMPGASLEKFREYFLELHFLPKEQVLANEAAAAKRSEKPPKKAPEPPAPAPKALRTLDEETLKKIPIKVTSPDIALDKVILTPECRERVDDFLGFIRKRDEVISAWGLDTALLGNAPRIAILHGPSGTGKTMVGQAIARELGLPHYYINMANIMSQWINESEKNIAELFDKVGACDAVLHIDEADSVLFDRASIGDSNVAESYISLINTT